MKTLAKTPVIMSFFLIGGAVLFLSLTSERLIKPSASPGGEWIAPASADTVKNPFKGDSKSLELGKKLYVKNCVVCHGDKGKGDGIAAAGLTPKPADHSSEKIQKQSDGSMFWKITNGRAPMASYKSFSAAERWALVNYVRTLKAPEKKH